MYSSAKLRNIAEKMLKGEGYTEGNYEISLVFCDDEFIQELNKTYRKKNKPTDVLSFNVPEDFPQGKVKPLGEIMISLETVMKKYPNEKEKAKQEIYLLFCHALLHLLGYVHDTAEQRKKMIEKQAQYLNLDPKSAWIKYPENK